ncbi:MAG: homocysteine biosynthesis protein [Vampirovibrionia bacterium]
MPKTIAEINEKIRKGKAIVFNAEEIIHVVEEEGLEKAAQMVDVVTTGTFSPMCSSSAIINTGHSSPKIRMTKAWLNNVEAYCGIAAVDLLIGATQMCEDDPLNKVFPGKFSYGGGHVIEDLIAGKDIHLKALSYGTDCYPRKEIETTININNVNNATLFNPRNAYQNYAVAVNKYSKRTIYTYMGILHPNCANANYSTSGQLSPLLNDPLYKTIGIGTKIFLGGGVGYVAWEGTQHNPFEDRLENGTPVSGAGTMAVIGNMKQMSPKWIRGASITGYGVSLTVGIGVPIPILNEEVLKYAAVKDEDIVAQIFDYSDYYPNKKPGNLGTVNYKELKSGTITIEGKEVRTACLSSYSKALEIANILKESIQKGEFELTEPVAKLPNCENGLKLQGLEERDLSAIKN